MVDIIIFIWTPVPLNRQMIEKLMTNLSDFVK